MAAQQNFRSAFNGFNREDVVHYLEYLNSKHASEISQLNSELDYLRSQLAAAPETETESVPAPATEEQAAQIQELLDSCNEKDALLETMLSEADVLKADAADKDAKIAQLQAELEALKAENAQLMQKPATTVNMEAELETYRRAERVERKAKERAELIYHRVNGTLADATVKVDDAAALIGNLTEQVVVQLSELQNAVTGSKAALKDAADTMYSLRPEPEGE